MIVKKGTVERLYYIEKDHLGSIIGLINSTGSYAERHSYDPWGRQRNPTNWSYDSITELKLTSLGYTGQEHLDMFGLINMNGRVYDPLISRFLNVDPIIQNPYSSHDLNNYSYCINNPLKYIDPGGYVRDRSYDAITITDPGDIEVFLREYLSHGGNLQYAELQVSGWKTTAIRYDEKTGMVDFHITVRGSPVNDDYSDCPPDTYPLNSSQVLQIQEYLTRIRTTVIYLWVKEKEHPGSPIPCGACQCTQHTALQTGKPGRFTTAVGSVPPVEIKWRTQFAPLRNSNNH